MRHSWRPPAGGRWQGSDERRQLGLSRRGHCWPTRRDPMSFASAARAAFALISVVTMINVGRGGESRPRGDGFSAHAPPAHADGLPLRCQETRAGTATSAAAGPDQGRQRRLVGVHGVAEAVAQGLVPAPHAARIRRTPDVPRRAVPYTGGDGRALAIVSSPIPLYPPSPCPILPRPASPNAGRGPPTLGFSACHSQRALEVLHRVGVAVRSLLRALDAERGEAAIGCCPPAEPPGPCGPRRSRTGTTSLRYVHRYGEGTPLTLCRSGSGAAAASRKQPPGAARALALQCRSKGESP